jgi:8-oxo-dGTP diphosphatase
MAERLKAFVAVHLLLINNDKVLLSRRFNTGYHDGDYSVPAGHVDVGETATHAMIRESMEEIGITISAKDLEYSTVMHRNSDDGTERIDFFFSCNKWVGEIKICEPNKCDDLRWVNISDLPKNTISYVQVGINCYQNHITFAEYGWENKN